MAGGIYIFIRLRIWSKSGKRCRTILTRRACLYIATWHIFFSKSTSNIITGKKTSVN
jgi:hypothetical protein